MNDEKAIKRPESKLSYLLGVFKRKSRERVHFPLREGCTVKEAQEVVDEFANKYEEGIRKMYKLGFVAVAGISLIGLVAMSSLSKTREGLLRLIPVAEKLTNSYSKAYSLMQSNRFDDARAVMSNYFGSVSGEAK